VVVAVEGDAAGADALAAAAQRAEGSHDDGDALAAPS
jgi:hypothetical protein